jgi:hypothetical protein
VEFDSLDDLENVDNDLYVGDEILDILVEFSPKSLVSISLSEYWKFSIPEFGRFFERWGRRSALKFDVLYKGDENYFTKQHSDIVRRFYLDGVIRKSNIHLVKKK